MTSVEQRTHPAVISLRHGDLFLAETIGTLGFDGVLIDMQHGEIGFEQAYLLLTALGRSASTSYVRIPGLDPSMAMKVLDAGAGAVVCPGIDSPADAALFVGACRYPPVGYRSLGPNRAGLIPGYAAGANEVIRTLVVIESEAAYANLEGILDVEHVDGVVLQGAADVVRAGIDRATPSGKEVLAVVDTWPLQDVDLPSCGVAVQDDTIYRGAFTAAVERLSAAAKEAR